MVPLFARWGTNGYCEFAPSLLRVGTRAAVGPSAFLLIGVCLVSFCDVVRKQFACVVLEDTVVFFVCSADFLKRSFSDSVWFLLPNLKKPE